MNFSSAILESLRKNGATTVAGFGTFYLKNTNAVVEQSGKHILPPGKEIAFASEFNDNSADLTKFIASEKQIPQFDAELEVKKLVNFWNGTLEKEQKLNVENIGSFSLDDSKIHFSGLRLENHSPDFYGLEQISISEIKKSAQVSQKVAAEKEYKFSNSLWWLMPLIAAVSALLYFGITQPELIFGKKSFQKNSEKPVQKAVKPIVQKDSAQIAATADSAKTDSAAAVPIKAPVKKWSSKKYSKSKWKKSKKRQNR